MRYSLFLFFCLVLFSCHVKEHKENSLEAVSQTDSCTVEPGHRYEIYVPSKQENDKLPLLVVIDSHGDGAFAIKKFIPLADQYSVVVVASDLVQNNFAAYKKEIGALIQDVREKYPVNEQLYMSGFSGGARMVLDYAQNVLPNGLLLCGALGEENLLTRLNCPVFSITGMTDFNFVETAQYIITPESRPANLKIELTDDTHQWPDPNVLTNAFGLIFLSQKGTDNQQIKAYCLHQQTQIDSLKNGNNYIKAALVAGNLKSEKQLDRKGTFNKEFSNLINLEEYKEQLQQLKEGLNFEMNARQPYYKALQEKDSVWWNNELESLEGKIKNEQNVLTKSMYLRIKNFWGIACYSICNNCIREHDAEKLAHILSVYKVLEPENPDVVRFSSVLNNWK